MTDSASYGALLSFAKLSDKIKVLPADVKEVSDDSNEETWHFPMKSQYTRRTWKPFHLYQTLFWLHDEKCFKSTSETNVVCEMLIN